MRSQTFPFFTVGYSGKPPERAAAVLEAPACEAPLADEQWTRLLSHHLRQHEGALPHASQLVKGKWPLAITSGNPRGDELLGRSTFRRLTEALPAQTGTLTAVHLGKRPAHRAVHDLLGWLCTDRLAGQPSGLAVLHTHEGLRWFGLAPTGATPGQPPYEWLAATSETLLTRARLAAYAYDRYRRTDNDTDLPDWLPMRPSWVKEAITL
ncbi:hypothetical protein ACWD64_21230 [Streptomyces antibioticus]